MNDGDRRQLEEAAARAWPPHETVAHEGWVLRFSGGGSQRANSVLTLRWSGTDIDAAITAAEHAYRERGQKPIFQIVDVSLPTDLDARLEARGYAGIDRTLLMTKSISKESSSSSDGPSGRSEDPCLRPVRTHTISRHTTAPQAWLDIYLATVTPDRRAAAPAIIAALPDPKCFFVAARDGAPFAVGLGMAEPPYCGIECMATEASARQSGGARAVLADLEAWAAEQGATTLWLQVLERNTPARALYDSLGFATVGTYWYRHAP
ncbi:hypothetical protein sos41_29830 [Alphaproteobacteria bacterium SO-S41]|nr:hypothetical protein sos41_29830 [Alphaproteobacteria bacterium SO-S41]